MLYYPSIMDNIDSNTCLIFSFKRLNTPVYPRLDKESNIYHQLNIIQFILIFYMDGQICPSLPFFFSFFITWVTALSLILSHSHSHSLSISSDISLSPESFHNNGGDIVGAAAGGVDAIEAERFMVAGSWGR